MTKNQMRETALEEIKNQAHLVESLTDRLTNNWKLKDKEVATLLGITVLALKLKLITLDDVKFLNYSQHSIDEDILNIYL